MSKLVFNVEGIEVSERGVYSASRWLFHDLSEKASEILYTTVQEGIEYEFNRHCLT